MRRRLHLIDYVIIFAGLISLIAATRTMLEVPTVIISAWVLVLMYGGILLLVSFGLGALIRLLTKSKIHSITGASFVVSVVCITFYIIQFKPTYKIYVPNKFKGEVKLFRSTLDKNKLSLSEYGVGYITDEEYRSGFRPIVYQNGRDITNECKNIVQGNLAFASVDGKSLGPFSYVGFTIGDSKNDTLWNNLTKVLELKVIDTSIIKK